MQIKRYPALNEMIAVFKLDNRLKVIVIEKPHYSKTYATLSCPIGALNEGYLDASKKPHKVPSGIAHFLEHKIFEHEGRDISRLFALDEAQINAFTEQNRTTYLFNATNHLEKNLMRLIDMFFYPKFTTEGVEKEKNIIKEELNMHLDDPHYMQYRALLERLFHVHPIKHDILGDVPSIDAITLNDLIMMHKAYYTPEASVLVVVGNVDATALENTLRTQVKLPDVSSVQPLLPHVQEPDDVVKKKDVITADILMPSVLMGFKTMPNTAWSITERLQHQLSLSIFLDLMFGKTSDMYETLMNKGLINDSYGLDIQLEADYGFAMLGGESDHPDALEKTLRERFESIRLATISRDDFNRVKKQMVGSFVMSLDSLEYIAYEMGRLALYDLVVYDVLDVAKTITYDQVLAHRNRLKASCVASVIMKPRDASKS